MRGNVPGYELIQARTLEQALARLGDGYRPFAGGTDVMVLFEAGKLEHKRFVSIWGLPELKGRFYDAIRGLATGLWDRLSHAVYGRRRGR